jgi:hypothetical protein
VSIVREAIFGLVFGGLADLLAPLFAGGAAAGAASAPLDLAAAGGLAGADVAAAAAPAAVAGADVFGPTLADLGISAGTAAGAGAVTGAEAFGPSLADLGIGAATPTLDASTFAGSLGASGQSILPTAATSTLPGTDVAAAAGSPLGTTLPGAGGVGASSVAAPAGALSPGTAIGAADPTAAINWSSPLSSIEGQMGLDPGTLGGATGAGNAAAAPASSGFNLSSLVSGAKDAATIGGPLVAGAGLLYNIEQAKKAGNPALAPQTAGIEALATQQAEAGQQMQSYLGSGTLPPGLQSGVTQALNAQQAALRQKYASMGMSTDPAQNSALATDLAAANQQAQTAIAQIGSQLYSLGQQGINLSSSDLQYLAGLSVSQSQATGNAISNFAAALNGMLKTGTGKGTTITVG